jgi:hypothetical protein
MFGSLSQVETFFYEQNDNNLDYNSKVKGDFKENSLIRSTYNK